MTSFFSKIVVFDLHDTIYCLVCVSLCFALYNLCIPLRGQNWEQHIPDDGVLLSPKVEIFREGPDAGYRLTHLVKKIMNFDVK